MNLTPDKIFELFINKNISKSNAYERLIAFIENSENEALRIDAIKILDKIGIYNNALFTILENILISDSNKNLRNAAAKFIDRRFINKALIPLKWVIHHESDFKCLITIIRMLKKINTNEAKLLLYYEVKKITKIKYINQEKRIENKRFKKIIKKLLKIKNFKDFTCKELSEIIINFLIIKKLTKQFPNAFYELDSQNGLVKELDLSDFFEFEVKGTPWGWKNDIKSLSEVSGLKYLHHLRKIDLSNNKIENLKDIVNSKKLTHLILTNNRITELKNLEYLKKLPNLEYLDLRYNDLVKKVNPNDFSPNIRVLLNDYLILK